MIFQDIVIVPMMLLTPLLVGLGLCQVGEFSFVLAEMGGRFGLLGVEHYQMFLAVAILTMGATPFLIKPGSWADCKTPTDLSTWRPCWREARQF